MNGTTTGTGNNCLSGILLTLNWVEFYTIPPPLWIFNRKAFSSQPFTQHFPGTVFTEPTDILHTQVTPPSDAPKTWHHFWKRNHLIYIKFHPRQEETVFEILSKSACSTSRPPAQEGWGQKVHAQPPRLRGSLIHGGWEVEQGWILVGNN